MSGRSSHRRARRCPRVLRSARVLLSRDLIATTTRSAGVADTPCLVDCLGLSTEPRAPDTFPVLDRHPFDWCHHPYAGADAGCIGPLPSPAPNGLHPKQRGSAAQDPTTCFPWDKLSTLQCSHSLRPQSSLALLTGPTVFSHSREDFCLSFHHAWSPSADVRHCYAAKSGNCCDGTLTRMVDVITGCTRLRLIGSAFARRGRRGGSLLFRA